MGPSLQDDGVRSNIEQYARTHTHSIERINVKQCCDLSGRHKKNICFIFHLLRISQFIFIIIITSFHGMFGDLLMFLFPRESIPYRTGPSLSADSQFVSCLAPKFKIHCSVIASQPPFVFDQKRGKEVWREGERGGGCRNAGHLTTELGSIGKIGHVQFMVMD